MGPTVTTNSVLDEFSHQLFLRHHLIRKRHPAISLASTTALDREGHKRSHLCIAAIWHLLQHCIFILFNVCESVNNYRKTKPYFLVSSKLDA